VGREGDEKLKIIWFCVILIIFAPEEAEIFKDYLFILAWFSVRLPLFSYDLKTIFVFWRIDIENHEFDGKKWEERGMRN
jgi:hypothetical protein